MGNTPSETMVIVGVCAAAGILLAFALALRGRKGNSTDAQHPDSQAPWSGKPVFNPMAASPAPEGVERTVEYVLRRATDITVVLPERHAGQLTELVLAAVGIGRYATSEVAVQIRRDHGPIVTQLETAIRVRAKDMSSHLLSLTHDTERHGRHAQSELVHTLSKDVRFLGICAIYGEELHQIFHEIVASLGHGLNSPFTLIDATVVDELCRAEEASTEGTTLPRSHFAKVAFSLLWLRDYVPTHDGDLANLWYALGQVVASANVTVPQRGAPDYYELLVDAAARLSADPNFVRLCAAYALEIGEAYAAAGDQPYQELPSKKYLWNERVVQDIL